MSHSEDEYAVPIRAALTRPELTMGCDRRLLGVVVMGSAIPGVLGVQMLRLDLVFAAVLLGALGIGALLRAGKEDPQFPAVWLRARRYPARMVAVGRVDRRARVRKGPA